MAMPSYGAGTERCRGVGVRMERELGSVPMTMQQRDPGTWLGEGWKRSSQFLLGLVGLPSNSGI